MKQLTIFTLIMLALSGLFGCKTGERFKRRFDNLAHGDNPKKALIPASKCALEYPVKTFTKTVVKTVAGKSDTVVMQGKADTVIQKGDTIIYTPIIKIVYRTDTNFIHDTSVEENTAALRAKELQVNAIASDLKAKTVEADKYKAEKRSWQGRALWTWGILLLLIVLWLIKKFGKFA